MCVTRQAKTRVKCLDKLFLPQYTRVSEQVIVSYLWLMWASLFLRIPMLDKYSPDKVQAVQCQQIQSSRHWNAAKQSDFKIFRDFSLKVFEPYWYNGFWPHHSSVFSQNVLGLNKTSLEIRTQSIQPISMTLLTSSFKFRDAQFSWKRWI